MEKKKEFKNGELTVVWQPEKCTHSGVCVKLLPEVYHPGCRPWVKLENATSAQIREQVSQCPSGALSIKETYDVRIEIEDNGKKGALILFEGATRAGEMTFTWGGDTMYIVDHTEVAPQFAGKGYAKQLMKACVEYARQKGVKIMPLCPFAKREMSKTPAYHDVLFS